MRYDFKSVLMSGVIRIGCAGWSVRKEHAELFAVDGTHLERYASRFPCVEINSSFYRPHRTVTYQRWAASVPAGFRFTVKFPKQVTHEQRLHDAQPEIEQFASQVMGLGDALGAVLAQLPPSLGFEAAIATEFFGALRTFLKCPLACEPRHASWFETDADALLQKHCVERVAADPSVVPAASVPGGSGDCAYFRWHGSPRMYYSSYEDARLKEFAEQVIEATRTAKTVYCIFDNTAAGAAVLNAFRLMELVEAEV
jgi:uncharacterized protein YecE (DUF72 family)